MKTVRMTGDMSGTRDGQNWPGPGETVEVTDAEARALKQGGMAQDEDHQADKVLVPPAGVHTPGRTAYGDVNLIEVPANAAADPEAATKAHKARLEGNYDKQVPSGTSVQNHDGSAMTAEAIDEGLKADEETAKDLGLPSPQDKAPASSTATKSTTVKSTDKTSDRVADKSK